MTLYTKALYAAVVAVLSGLLTALNVIGDDATLKDLNTAAVVTLILAFLVAGGGILALQAAPARIATSIRE